MSYPHPQLAEYNARGLARGRPVIVEIAWIIAQALFVSSFLPGSLHRRILLRLFGAKVGAGVVVKPGIRVKFPWRLIVGDHSWLGENIWIDNLALVRIGRNCVVSQGAYICTGSHDWGKASFDLIAREVELGDGAWVCAKASVGPGVTLGEGSVLSLGSVATSELAPWTIYQGVPARRIGSRLSTEGTPRVWHSQKDRGTNGSPTVSRRSAGPAPPTRPPCG